MISNSFDGFAGTDAESLVRFRVKDWLEDGLPEMPQSVRDDISRMLAAAAMGDAWSAAWWALQVGAEWTNAVPYAAADRGNKTYRSAVAGGRATKQAADEAAPNATDLRSEVEALRRRNPQLSLSAACDRVGKVHGLSGRTVRRRIA